MFKKALIASAALVAMAAPASAEIIRYDLDGGGFVQIDNVSGDVILQDASGSQAIGSGERFKDWRPNTPFFSGGAACNGICETNKYMFDSLSGSFNGSQLNDGDALIVLFRLSGPLAEKISIWTGDDDIHISPGEPQIISSSSTSSGGSSSSTSGGSSTTSTTSGGSSTSSSGGSSSSGSSSSSSSSGGVPVPAPGMLALFGLGAGAVLARRRRKA